MVKKIVGVGLAATLAVSLWSTVPPTSKRIVAKLHKLEARYKAMVAWSESADQ